MKAKENLFASTIEEYFYFKSFGSKLYLKMMSILVLIAMILNFRKIGIKKKNNSM